MNECDIIENTACGKAFKYCRTHKVEPQDCPGAKKPEGVDSLAALQYAINKMASDVAYEIAPRFQGATKKPFRAGGKAKALISSGGGAFVAGNIYEVLGPGKTVDWPRLRNSRGVEDGWFAGNFEVME